MVQKTGQAPIIIKRRRKAAGDGHHGGAWKVAYADFVTAMMAFFLLMWLLNATTEDQRMALAQYFTPTISVSQTSGGGDGALMGDSIFAQDILLRRGTGASGIEEESEAAQSELQIGQIQGESVLRTLVEGAGHDAGYAEELLDHIGLRATDEGLILELFSRPDRPLFAAQGDALTPLGTDLLGVVAQMGDVVRNAIAVQVLPSDSPSDSMEWLAFDRARTAAQQMLDHGFPADRLDRVTAGRPQTGELSPPSEDQIIRITFLRGTIE